MQKTYIEMGSEVDIEEKILNGTEKYFVVDVDKNTEDGIFAITPIEDNQYEKLEDIPLNINEVSIEKNDNNNFSYNAITDRELTQKYFSYYKSLMLNNPEKAYEMLDEEERNGIYIPIRFFYYKLCERKNNTNITSYKRL